MSDETTQTADLSETETLSADRQAVAEVIGKARIAVVTTVDTDGSLVSRPLALQQRDFDGDLYFFVPDGSDKVDQVRSTDQVNVALQTDGDYLSVAGTATISKDQALIDQLWNRHAEAWFEGGRDDPSVALLKVHADSAELLGSDSPRVLGAVKYAKALVTGAQPDLGDATRVEL